MSLMLAISLVGLVAFGVTKAVEVDSAYGMGAVLFVDGNPDQPRDIEISMVPDRDHPSWSKEFDFGFKYLTNSNPIAIKTFYVRNNYPTPGGNYALPLYDMHVRNIDNAEFAQDLNVRVTMTYNETEEIIYEGSLLDLTGLTEHTYIPVDYIWGPPTQLDMMFSIEGVNVSAGEQVNYELVLTEVVN